MFHPLQPEDIPELKKIVGEGYIANIIERATLDDLKRIAATEDRAGLLASPVAGVMGPSVELVITDDNALSIRRAAAEKALLRALANSNDLSALEAIEQATDTASLVTALTNNESLGFSGPGANTNIRNVLSGLDNITGIRTVARLRTIAVSGDVDKLKTCLQSPGFGDLAARVHDEFPSDTVDREAIGRHFSDPRNVGAFAWNALTHIFKDTLPSVDDALSDALTHGLTADQVAAVLGNDWLTDDTRRILADDRFRAALIPYVQAEAHARRLGDEPLDRQRDAINRMDDDAFARLPQEKDRDRMRARLTASLIEALPLPDEDAVGHLMALVRAGDVAQAKTALGSLGITATNWVDEQTMEDVQKSACARAILHQMDSKSHYNRNFRPELLDFLTELPLETQRQLVMNDDVMSALFQASRPEDIRALLNLRPETVLSPNLINEMQRIHNSRSIINAGLALALADCDLDTGRMSAINNLLEGYAADAFSAANYVATIQNIAGQLSAGDRVVFYQGCGLNDEGTALLDADGEAIRQSIENQQGYNAALLARPTGGYSPNTLRYRHLLLSLNKGAELTVAQSNALLQALMASQTRRQLFESPAFQALDEVTQKSLRERLTADRFTQLHRGLNHDNFLIPTQVTANLGRMRADLARSTQLITDLAATDQDLRPQLQKLADLDNLPWLNPEFQAVAKRKGQDLKARLAPLARSCDTIVKQFQTQLTKIDNQLASLPDSNEVRASTLSPQQKQEIETFRQELMSARRIVVEGLVLYEPLHLKLNGDPAAADDTFEQHGVMGVLDEAIGGKKDITRFYGYSSTFKDYDLSQKADLLAGNGRAAISPGSFSMSAETDTDDASYEVGDKVQPGKLREYTIGRNDASKGCFIEERQANDMTSVTEKGRVTITPKATYTISKWPPANNPDMQVELAMAMACQILRDRDANPAAKARPLVLRHGTPDQIACVWTALVLIGKKNPQLGITPETIKVDSAGFDPKDQLGFLPGNDGFSRNSAYCTMFKGNPKVDDITKNFGKASSERFLNHKKQHRELKEVSRAVQPLGKALEDNFVEEMRRSNEEDAPPGLNP